MASQGQRRDSKHRILHTGESIRANEKYQYTINEQVRDFA
ncbi:integrase DNA-binding domain-containing protein [Mediterraneibacter agrestimuris]|nr:integrase DNA-binding domain-containing protein [Mediterraneibacter agrestimuris]